MNEAPRLVLAFVAGLFLGTLFFGGLWWTIRRGISAGHPALWFFASRLLRTGVVMLGFYFFLGDNWHKLLLGLAGFIAARFIAMRISRGESAAPVAMEAGHAP
ncbi:MAG: ATP synthase subunit I [Gallionella sp.]|nr:ATP synthase subunit I [Gallionella sp.]